MPQVRPLIRGSTRLRAQGCWFQNRLQPDPPPHYTIGHTPSPPGQAGKIPDKTSGTCRVISCDHSPPLTFPQRSLLLYSDLIPLHQSWGSVLSWRQCFQGGAFSSPDQPLASASQDWPHTGLSGEAVGLVFLALCSGPRTEFWAARIYSQRKLWIKGSPQQLPLAPQWSFWSFE